MKFVERFVRKAQKGDKDAFLRLMDEYQLPMYRTAKAILQNEDDVEDAVQEAVYRAFYKISSIRQPKFFKTWLTRVVINCSYDLLRQRQGLRPAAIVVDGHVPPLPGKQSRRSRADPPGSAGD